jgi:hypothetical protein
MWRILVESLHRLILELAEVQLALLLARGDHLLQRLPGLCSSFGRGRAVGALVLGRAR